MSSAIIDATMTTVVSLQSFLGSGLPLSGESIGDNPDRVTVNVAIPELGSSLDWTSSAANTARYQQVDTQILADTDRHRTALIATQATTINTARGILNYSLHTLESYRPAAQNLSCHPTGQEVSDRLQMVVCGAVVRGALAAFDSLACANPMDAARLQALIEILTEVSRQLHTG